MRTPRLLFVILSLVFSTTLIGEGSRQLAPNPMINVAGNISTDIAAIYFNHAAYNSFASFNNPDPNARLNIHVLDPSTECLFLGFSYAHPNFTGTNPIHLNYRFRIKDPNGNVVFGPYEVNIGSENITNWSEAVTGPNQIFGSGGYDGIEVSGTDLMSQGWTGEGDFYIEFQVDNADPFLIDFWDITVADCSTSTPSEKLGRIWSYNWALFAINDYGFPERPFNGSFYVCAPDPANPEAAYVTHIDFNGSGFRPAAFNIAFNSFGALQTGDIIVDRRSVENLNSTTPEYAIFLNDPTEVCETAESGTIELFGISRCDAEDFVINFLTTKEGQIDLLLDFDGDDQIYSSGTADIIITLSIDDNQVGQIIEVPWDGRDGLGVQLLDDVSTQIPIFISFAQGIYHFPIYDAEYMTEGVQISAVRPPGPVPSLYYDDSGISQLSGSGEPQVQLAGCDLPCHRWTNYTDPNFVGFGNLNTINSWWFSQQITAYEVYTMPAYYTCAITGPNVMCEGSTVDLNYIPDLTPSNAIPPEQINTIWSGPGIIGSASGSTIVIDSAGIYTVNATWINAAGDTCSSSCNYTVVSIPTSEETIDTTIFLGETIVINNESFNESGTFTQVLTAVNGCDSILTIIINTIVADYTVVYYDMEDCRAMTQDSSNEDYSELTPMYFSNFDCGILNATYVFREVPQINKHSCTNGVQGSTAMCISSNGSCTYTAGSDRSAVFEVKVTPDAGKSFTIKKLIFWEKAPEEFVWLNGDSGPNNWPTLYGVRVLKNGVEIFRSADNPTTYFWSLEQYPFDDIPEFTTTTQATYRFEFLAYCPVGNGAQVAAWDLDEIRVRGRCTDQNLLIGGSVDRIYDGPLEGATISLDMVDGNNYHRFATTSDAGEYTIIGNPGGHDYILKGQKNSNWMEDISVLDVIYLRHHLLGIKSFDSPFQFLAADVTNNQHLSAADVIELRSLILGKINQFSNHSSWLIGAADQDLAMDDPWAFRTDLSLNQLVRDIYNADFDAIKVGDINGASLSNINGNNGLIRFDNKIELYAQDHEYDRDEIFEIDIYINEETALHGLQFSIDLRELAVFDVTSPVLTELDFHFDRNTLNLLWASGDEQPVSNKEVLFTLHVKALGNGSVKDVLTINRDRLMPLAYQGQQLEPMDISLAIKTRSVLTHILDQNRPNPFIAETVLPFYLAYDDDITFEFFTPDGKKVFAQSKRYPGGSQVLKIGKGTIGHFNKGIDTGTDDFVQADPAPDHVVVEVR